MDFFLCFLLFFFSFVFLFKRDSLTVLNPFFFVAGSPFLIISVLFFSVAVGQCDNTALQNCATTYVNGALTLASFADRTTGECTLLRDFFQCLFNACPGVQQEIRDALQAYQTVFNQCGFILPGAAGLAGTNICLLAGDPHVLRFDRTWQDCKLTSGETVFSDGDNTVTVEADADVSWADQDLTAVRYVKVVTRSGTYEFFANDTSSTFASPPITPTTGLTINPNSIVDTTKSTWIRVDRYRDGNEFWLNVLIRAKPDTATGVCKDGCPNGRAPPSLESLMKKSSHGKRNGMTVCSAAGLSGQLLANCVADVDNTGLNNMANSSTAANSEIRVADDLGGNSGAILTFSATLIGLVVAFAIAL